MVAKNAERAKQLTRVQRVESIQKFVQASASREGGRTFRYQMVARKGKGQSVEAQTASEMSRSPKPCKEGFPLTSKISAQKAEMFQIHINLCDFEVAGIC